MTIISGYLNQTAIWHRKVGQDKYGAPKTRRRTIKVRWEDVRVRFSDKEGREAVSNARVFCRDNVTEDDLLEYRGRKWPVRKVSAPPWLDGSAAHREVLL